MRLRTELRIKQVHRFASIARTDTARCCAGVRTFFFVTASKNMLVNSFAVLAIVAVCCCANSNQKPVSMLARTTWIASRSPVSVFREMASSSESGGPATGVRLVSFGDFSKPAKETRLLASLKAKRLPQLLADTHIGPEWTRPRTEY